LNRRHTALQAVNALETIKNETAFQVGVDLMYGLPGQTELSWLETLEKAIRFQPEHISCYQLTFEDRTPFGKMLADGKISALCEEDERAFFILTSTFLQRHGYVHYEISNFARGQENASRHNRKYWQHALPRPGPFCSFFSTRHPVVERARPSDLFDCLKQGIPPLARKSSPRNNTSESLMLGFRTGRVHRGLIASERGSRR
jgi:oxygen-independent coproporphyrinogen-3 oxidase